MHVGLFNLICKFDVPLKSLLLPYYSVWTHNVGGDCRNEVLAHTICVPAVVRVCTYRRIHSSFMKCIKITLSMHRS